MKLGDILHLVATSETGRALGRLESYRTSDDTVIGVRDLLNIWDYLNTELPVALVTEAPEPEPELEELEALEELKPEPVVVKPAPVKKKAQSGGRKPIDDGRIMALRAAGWSYSKIADDLGCSPQTIVNHVEAMKNKGGQGND